MSPSMLLAIDSGNTNTVFAVIARDGTIRRQWRSATGAERTADEYGVWLDRLMTMDGLERPAVEHAILASVVPAADFHLKTLCRTYFGCDPLVVGEPDVDLGIGVRVERPEQVGADRLANAVSAGMRYRCPLIVVDFGTATTFDVIDADGSYAGGIIAPGANLSLRALHMAAAQLPRVAVTRPARVIGTDTVSAMQSGIFWGHVALIEGMVARIRQECGAAMDAIATGGLAPLFNEHVDCIEAADPDLTLHGLYHIHLRNRPR